jgi:O-antigen/teichoic acid export membrane protein
MWNLANAIVPQLYLLVISIAAARFLGPDTFGRQSFIAFVELSVLMLLAAGVPQSLARHVADAIGRDDAASGRGLVSWAWRLQLGIAVFSFGVLASVGLAGATPESAWVLAGVATAAGIAAAAPRGLLYGMQDWRRASLIGLVTGGFGAVATLVVLAAGGRIVAMFAVEAVVATGALVWTSLLGRGAERRLAPVAKHDPELTRAALRYAGLMTISIGLTIIIWRRTEVFFLEHYSTNAQVGFYSIAFAGSAVLAMLFQALSAALLPAVATLWGAGQHDRISSGYSRAVRLILLLALPLTALSLALGPELVLVVYGHRYADAREVLVILLSITPLVAMLYMSAALLAAIGRLRPMLVAGVVASAVTISFDFLLIPAFDSVGAAFANLGGQITVGVWVVIVTRGAVGDVHWRPAIIVRISLASVLAGASAWACVALLGGAAGVACGAVVGVALFALLGGILGIIDAGDASWLDDTVGGVGGGLTGRLIRFWARPAIQRS